MTPPTASDQGTHSASDVASAVFVIDGPVQVIQTLTRRADFLRAASAQRVGTGSFLLQARPREDGQTGIRIGFTASKKIGNAVARNRAKRRMRAVIRAVLPGLGQAGWDYVLVAKPQATITRDYADLQADLTRALGQIHKTKPQP